MEGKMEKKPEILNKNAYEKPILIKLGDLRGIVLGPLLVLARVEMLRFIEVQMIGVHHLKRMILQSIKGSYQTAILMHLLIRQPLNLF